MAKPQETDAADAQPVPFVPTQRGRSLSPRARYRSFKPLTFENRVDTESLIGQVVIVNKIRAFNSKLGPTLAIELTVEDTGEQVCIFSSPTAPLGRQASEMLAESPEPFRALVAERVGGAGRAYFTFDDPDPIEAESES